MDSVPNDPFLSTAATQAPTALTPAKAGVIDEILQAYLMRGDLTAAEARAAILAIWPGADLGQLLRRWAADGYRRTQWPAELMGCGDPRLTREAAEAGRTFLTL